MRLGCAAGRADLAETEAAELVVLEGFLPRLLGEDETSAIVAAAIEVAGATSAADVGKVMGAVMKQHKGKVDGKLARAIAMRTLAQ